MSIIWTILIGFIVGIVAKFLMPGRDPAGFITAIIYRGLHHCHVPGPLHGLLLVGESAGFIAAVVGAIILLFLYRLVTARKG